MAKVISKGYVDTPVSGVSALTLNRAVLNVEKDYRVKSSTPGKEIVLTNITCPVDRPEIIRVQYSDIGNIYSGSSIEPSVLAPTKHGARIYAGISDVVSVSDSVDPNYRIDLPLQCSLMIKAPSSEYITSALILEQIGRLLSSLFNTGVSDTSRLEAILRGSLKPSGL